MSFGEHIKVHNFSLKIIVHATEVQFFSLIGFETFIIPDVLRVYLKSTLKVK